MKKIILLIKKKKRYRQALTRNYDSNCLYKTNTSKQFKTDIFNDNYQRENKNNSINQKKYETNYVKGELNSSIKFMTPVN